MAVKAFLVSTHWRERFLPGFVSPTQLKLPEILPWLRAIPILGRVVAMVTSVIRAAYLANYLAVGDEVLLVEHKGREEAVYELGLLKDLLRVLRADLRVRIEIMPSRDCEKGFGI